MNWSVQKATPLFQLVHRSLPQQGNGRKQYSYVDDLGHVTASRVYYRLKMIDKDGRFTFSQVVSIDVAVKRFQVEGKTRVQVGQAAQWSNGTYFLQVTSTTGSVTKKLLIQH
jgi:hypothetical protein